MTLPSHTSEISLNSGWNVTRVDGPEAAKIDFPGDVHTALQQAGIIGDPYWRDREVSLDWIHQSEWVARRHFQFEAAVSGHWQLSLDSVDCHVIVVLNGQEVGTLSNRFMRYDLDVSTALITGENTLELRFLSNSAMAIAKSESFPFPVPYIKWNNRIPHYNFLRKPQCDAGWDWNIALSPLGVYGDIELRPVGDARLDDVTIRQFHAAGKVTVEVDLHCHAVAPVQTTASMSIGGQSVRAEAQLWPGTHTTTLAVTLADPRLWWPLGHGDQDMYELTLTLGSETRQVQIGLRQVELITEADAIGNRFAFRVNGREIFMRGANWIPADALAGRITQDSVADLLDSAVEANMNMLRVWGGGTYEPDWFYQMCSERGLLIWQDFMFSCNLYPAADRAWLEDVRLEARQQVRRLSAHPCIALWCGDNELVGAIGWFDESKADRDRYLAMYDRLNHALEEIIEDARTGIPWWPSSPSCGPLNFGDGWHDDSSGDMHFWDVWHEAKDFEHYRTVKPRFCSEFGFQSFPSPALIKTFTDPSDRNVSSQVMDVHQRNDGGNSRIVETIARYFRFPDGFDEMCWLSQVGQALAMKTAIECWRASKPRCMGTLFWQLNDTWPVASWASLEYGGGWKLTQYMARRFYAPVMISAQPDPATGDIVLWAVNDTPNSVVLRVSAQRVDVAGPVSSAGEWSCNCPAEAAVEVGRIASNTLLAQEILHFAWQDAARHHVGENDYFPRRPKEYALEQPVITATRDGDRVTLSTDKPAFYVTYDHGGAEVWSDNCFTLLPGSPKVLTLVRSRSGTQQTEAALASTVTCLGHYHSN